VTMVAAMPNTSPSSKKMLIFQATPSRGEMASSHHLPDWARNVIIQPIIGRASYRISGAAPRRSPKKT
jgi:hypothetical protein